MSFFDSLPDSDDEQAEEEAKALAARASFKPLYYSDDDSDDDIDSDKQLSNDMETTSGEPGNDKAEAENPAVALPPELWQFMPPSSVPRLNPAAVTTQRTLLPLGLIHSTIAPGSSASILNRAPGRPLVPLSRSRSIPESLRPPSPPRHWGSDAGPPLPSTLDCKEAEDSIWAPLHYLTPEAWWPQDLLMEVIEEDAYACSGPLVQEANTLTVLPGGYVIAPDPENPRERLRMIDVGDREYSVTYINVPSDLGISGGPPRALLLNRRRATLSVLWDSAVSVFDYNGEYVQRESMLEFKEHWDAPVRLVSLSHDFVSDVYGAVWHRETQTHVLNPLDPPYVEGWDVWTALLDVADGALVMATDDCVVSIVDPDVDPVVLHKGPVLGLGNGVNQHQIIIVGPELISLIDLRLGGASPVLQWTHKSDPESRVLVSDPVELLRDDGETLIVVTIMERESGKALALTMTGSAGTPASGSSTFFGSTKEPWWVPGVRKTPPAPPYALKAAELPIALPTADDSTPTLWRSQHPRVAPSGMAIVPTETPCWVHIDARGRLVVRGLSLGGSLDAYGWDQASAAAMDPEIRSLAPFSVVAAHRHYPVSQAAQRFSSTAMTAPRGPDYDVAHTEATRVWATAAADLRGSRARRLEELKANWAERTKPKSSANDIPLSLSILNTGTGLSGGSQWAMSSDDSGRSASSRGTPRGTPRKSLKGKKRRRSSVGATPRGTPRPGTPMHGTPKSGKKQRRAGF